MPLNEEFRSHFPPIIRFFAAAENSHLGITNNPPLEQQHSTLQRLIVGAERDISTLDAKLKSLEDMLASCQRNRQQASSELELSKRVLSPIRRLPREVIAEIVLHALQSSKIPDKWSVVATLDTRMGPWKYGQVCRIWREAVLSFPQLWTHFRFDQATTPHSMKPRRYENLMTMLVERSQKLPISFVFDEQALHESAGLLRLLVGQCHRWKDVELTIDSEVSFVGLNDVQDKLPWLERLCLTARFGLLDAEFDVMSEPQRREKRQALRMHGFAEAPRLLTLNLDLHMHLDVLFPVEQVSWYEEREFGMWSPYDEHCLPEFINVVECILGLTNWADIRPVGDGPIELPRLRRLEIKDPQILDDLIAPNLRILDLDITEESVELEFSSICTMLRANTCALESFTCKGIPENDDLIQALQLMPSLTSLRLLDTPYDPEIFRCLTAHPTESHTHGTLVPKLEVLTMAMMSISAEDHRTEFGGADDFVRMVESRFKSAQSYMEEKETKGEKEEEGEEVARLRQVYLTVAWLGTKERFPERARQRFREMEREGLHAILESRRAGWPMDARILADCQSQRGII